MGGQISNVHNRISGCMLVLASGYIIQNCILKALWHYAGKVENTNISNNIIVFIVLLFDVIHFLYMSFIVTVAGKNA